MATDQEVISDIVYAPIDLAATGDLVAAVSGQRIVVHSLWLIAAADTTVKFRSGGATSLSGAATVKSGSGMVLNHNKAGWFRTLVGQKLDVLLGTSTQVS